MKYPVTFTVGLLLLAAQSASWAEIYKTTDADGNPVFTDAPVDASSSAVELPETNISDAPPQAPGDAGPASSPAGQKTPATTHSTEHFLDPNAGRFEEHERRVQEQERTPYENLVGEEPEGTIDGEAPHQTEGGAAPHETEGGAEPHETEGGAEPHETEGGAEPHETEGAPEPQEVGDF
jgi:hypothetical protein